MSVTNQGICGSRQLRAVWGEADWEGYLNHCLRNVITSPPTSHLIYFSIGVELDPRNLHRQQETKNEASFGRKPCKMASVAYVSSLTLRSTSFTPSKSKALSSRTNSLRSNSFSTPRRSRIIRSPIAQVQPPTEDDLDAAGFETVLQQFSLAAMGAYAAMSGISPALAVPEALVEAFKSKPASLVHPAVMWLLLATCLYTFYLGYKSSTVRKVDSAERKELAKGKFSERHFKTSSALFAIMTIATFSGMGNTYARTGKLFPGPHLYAGLGLVATMSVMSAFVPYMQRGKDWARNAHFTVAFAAVGLFGWQAKSGMAIVGKLLGWD